MHVVWLADAPRLPDPAITIALAALAARCGIGLPDDATVVVEERLPLPGQQLVAGHDGAGHTTWFTSPDALDAVLATRAEGVLRGAGVDPAEPAGPRALRRLLLRRLPHFTSEQLDELVALHPRLSELAAGEEEPLR